MVAAALVLLCASPPSALAATMPSHPGWLLPAPTVVIVGREIAMSALREWAAQAGGAAASAVAVSSLGKWKTAAQMVAVSLLLAADALGAAGAGWAGWAPAAAAGGAALLWAAAGLAAASFAAYARALRPHLA